MCHHPRTLTPSPWSLRFMTVSYLNVATQAVITDYIPKRRPATGQSVRAMQLPPKSTLIIKTTIRRAMMFV